MPNMDNIKLSYCTVCLLPQRTFVTNMKFYYFPLVQLLHNSLVAMVTIFPYQQGKPVIPTLLKKVSAKLE